MWALLAFWLTATVCIWYYRSHVCTVTAAGERRSNCHIHRTECACTRIQHYRVRRNRSRRTPAICHGHRLCMKFCSSNICKTRCNIKTTCVFCNLSSCFLQTAVGKDTYVSGYTPRLCVLHRDQCAIFAATTTEHETSMPITNGI